LWRGSDEALSICFAAPIPARQAKSRKREATVVNMEKIVTEAFKNKQVETFRKYLAPEFVGLDAEGFKNVDAELAEVPKYDVRENSFADMKLASPVQYGSRHVQKRPCKPLTTGRTRRAPITSQACGRSGNANGVLSFTRL